MPFSFRLVSPLRRTAFTLALASIAILSAAPAAAQSPQASAPPATQTSASNPSASLPTLGTEPVTGTANTDSTFNYTLGGAVIYAPAYIGADTQRARVRPFFAAQYGRWSIADSRATTVTDFGAGASYALIDRASWRASLGLRLDNGRKSADSPELVGFDDVKATLRGRASVSWTPQPNWNVSSSVQTDLLGRKGGTTLGIGASRSFPLGPTQRISVSAGAMFADRQNMMTYFGVDAATALRSGKPKYTPGAGLRDVGVGVSHNLRISERWFMMTSAGVAQLVGGAADSPIARTRTQSAVTLSVAYQCCGKR